MICDPKLMHDDTFDGWFEDATHIRPVRVYYEDTDATGVVYHAAYLKFFERGRTDYLRCAGLRHADLAARPDPLFFVVARAEISFRRGARIDDRLHVRTRYLGHGGARVEMAQEIARGAEVIAEATITAASVDAAGRPRRLPADVAGRLADLRQALAKRGP